MKGVKIYFATPDGVIIPCKIKNNIIRPLVNGGYKILRELGFVVKKKNKKPKYNQGIIRV